MARLLRALSPRVLHWSQSMAEPTRFPETARAARAMSTQTVGVGNEGHTDGVSMRSPREDIPYAVQGLSHIAIAVPDLSQAAEHYRSAFGAQVSEPLEKLDQGVTVVFVNLPKVCIELLHPLGEQSPISKFLQRNPKGGIHHICLEVDDVNSAVNYLSSEVGVHTVGNSAPTLGAEGKPILFLNPKDNHGVLIELQEAKEHLPSKNDQHMAC